MKSVSICHAPADRERALELARFIEVNFGFETSFENAGCEEDSDIVAGTERALSANFAIVLFSPASVPAPLKRERWQPVFGKAPQEYGSRLAFVLLSECPFPQVLKRMHFFDGSVDFLGCKRELKRWIMAQHRTPLPDGPAAIDVTVDRRHLEPLWREIVDRPGFASGVDASVAAALARQSRPDFERVLRVRCVGRPLAVIAGELGRALDMRLTGPVEENLQELASQARGHRYLLVFEGAPRDMHEQLRFADQCSVVIAEAEPKPPSDVERITVSNVADAIDRALSLLASGADAEGLFALGVIRFLRNHAFRAEEALMLDAIRRWVPSRADWAQNELDWIQAHWGRPRERRRHSLRDSEQLDLFGEGGYLSA